MIFSLWSSESSLYSLYTCPSINHEFTNNFPLLRLLNSLNSVLQEAEFFILMKSNLSMCFFMCHDFSVISKILVSISTGLFLLNSRLQRLFLMISSNFYSLIFHFRPMICLKLIFEHAIRAKSPFFPIRGYPIISIICWKDYLFKLMLLVRFVESDLDI